MREKGAERTMSSLCVWPARPVVGVRTLAIFWLLSLPSGFSLFGCLRPPSSPHHSRTLAHTPGPEPPSLWVCHTTTLQRRDNKKHCHRATTLSPPKPYQQHCINNHQPCRLIPLGIMCLDVSVAVSASLSSAFRAAAILFDWMKHFPRWQHTKYP